MAVDKVSSSKTIKKTTTVKAPTVPKTTTPPKAGVAQTINGFQLASWATAADIAYAQTHKINAGQSAASQNWGADNKVSPVVPAALAVPVQTSLQGVNQMPSSALSQVASLSAGQNRATAVAPTVQTSLQGINQMASAYVSSTPASSLGIAGGGAANVGSTKAQNQTVGKGAASVAPTIGGGTSYNPGGTYSLGGEQLYLSPNEPKGGTYYPPQTAGNTLGVAGAGALNAPGAMTPAVQSGSQPGSFTGSEPKASSYYQPPTGLPPGWNGVPQGITMADYNAYLRYVDVLNSGQKMGQVTPNMMAVSEGQLTPDALLNMGYQLGSGGNWYFMGDSGGSGVGGGGSSSGGGGGGGGGYSSGGSSYGYGASDLLNWRIGT